MNDKKFVQLVRKMMPLWIEMFGMRSQLSPQGVKAFELLRGVMDNATDEGNQAILEEALEALLE